VSETITYRDLWHYKYYLLEKYSILTKLQPKKSIVSGGGWVNLTVKGTLTMKAGYCWNGASSAKDTPSNMRPSLVHDALYQLMREGLLPQSYRSAADDLYQALCREDGMNRFRAWYHRKVLLHFAEFAAKENDVPEIVRLTAP